MKNLIVLSIIIFSAIFSSCQKTQIVDENVEIKTLLSMASMEGDFESFINTDFDGEMIISISESLNYPTNVNPIAVITGGLWNTDKTGLEDISGAEIGSISIPEYDETFNSNIDISTELESNTNVDILDPNGSQIVSFNIYFPQRLT